jgi:hypothetical protein
MMAMDYELHLHNQDRVRDLAHDERAGVRVFCSHDPIELEALQRLSGSDARSRNAGTRTGQWRGETGAHATG